MKIISTLTKRHILKNKKRSLVTLIGITLTSALLFTVGFIYGTFKEHEIDSIKSHQGLQDAIYSNVSFDKRDTFNNNDIKKYEYVTLKYTAEIDSGGYLGTSKAKLKIYAISDNFELKYFIGNRPTNDKQLVISANVSLTLNLNIGDTITLKTIDLNEKELEKEYTISGVYNVDLQARNIYALEAYTKEDITNEQTDFYVYLKNKDNAYKKLDKIAAELNLKKVNLRNDINNYEGLTYNTTLLEVYGNYNNNQNKAIIFVSLFLILATISIFCATLIYNSFAISLMERNKQIGMLKSIGMTNRQVIKMIFKEAFYLSLIAIPLGFILSYFLVTIGVYIINYLLKDVQLIKYVVSIYPNYIILCLIFIIVTIAYSAFFPSVQATIISPIESIRGNKKIKNKYKRKPNKLISKLFGISGLIAFNSIKRNKSKYRITTFAVTVSFLLFMTIVTYINFFQKQILDPSEVQDGIYGYSNSATPIDEAVNLEGVKDYVTFKSDMVFFKSLDKISKEYKIDTGHAGSFIYTLNKEKYEQLKKELNITNDDPILFNYGREYDLNGNFKLFKLLDDNKDIELYSFESNYNTQTNTTIYKEKECIKRDINLIDEIPKVLKKFSKDLGYGLILNEDDFKSLSSINSDYNYYYLISNDYVKIDKKLQAIYENNFYSDFSYSNYGLQNFSTLRTLSVVKLILYSLIILFSLIGITSIVNTITANMTLRKSEFAVLKSVGLDNKQFDKMLLLEGTFLSIKSLIFAIPLTFLVTRFIRDIINIPTIYSFKFNQVFALDYFILGIIMVFVVINLTIYLATRNFKKQNIMEDIRNENV